MFFKVPKSIFYGMVFLLSGIISFCLILAFNNVYLLSQINKYKNDNQLEINKTIAYENFFKEFLVNLEIKKFYLEKKFLIGEGGPATIPNIGGKGGLVYDLEKIKNEKINSRKFFLKNLSGDELISDISQNMHYLDKNLDLIRNINIGINKNKRSSQLKSLPFFLPAKQTDIKRVVSGDKYIYLEVVEGANILATAEGKIINVLDKNIDEKMIVIEHNFGLTSYYYGFDEALVDNDQKVLKGEKIAKAVEYKKIFYRIKMGRKFVNPVDFVFLSQ